MRYILIYISFFVILNGSADQLNLTKKEKEWIKQHPVIKLSNQLNWAPYDYSIDGEARGYSIDIIKEISKKTGIKVEFIVSPTWSDLLKKFEKKEIDLMHAMTWNKERENNYIYSNSYMPNHMSYIIRDDETDINSLSDLDGKTIAVAKDWEVARTIKRNFPNSTIVELTNSEAIVKALSFGDVDVAVDNMLTVKYLMSKYIITNLKHGGYIQRDDGRKEQLFFVTNKENPELISIFNKAYELIDVDQKLQLQNKWFAGVNLKNLIFSNEERKYLQKKQHINMCIDPNWMPYEKFDNNGNHIGMTSEYFEIFEKKIGVPIRVFRTKTWTESIDAAKKRKCDIFSLAMHTPEREEYMDFTSPYLSIPLVLATRLDVSFINDVEYIKNKKVAIVKDYAFNEIIRAKYPNIEVVDVKDINDGLQRVANGELFGFIGTLASVGYTFQKNFMGELKITGKFDEKWDLGIATRNDEPLLQNIFQKAINSLSIQIQQDILNRYIAIKYEKGKDYSLVVKILIGMTILGFIGLYFYRRLSLVNKKMKSLQKKLVEQANRDPMTNLYNRRYLYDVASDLLTISKRENKSLGIIILDIDNFKNINDNYGHAVGDEVIKKISNILTSSTRDSDIVSRFGGEEFTILLPNTDKNGASKIASKLRELTEKESVFVGKIKRLRFTISLGVDSILKDDETIDKSIGRADKALYKAKKSGKNQVCIFNDDL